MRLLVDHNLPQRPTTALRTAGHDAIHTIDVDLATASDSRVFIWCCSHKRALLTADKKLTKFLASSAADCPSVLIVRELCPAPLEVLADVLTTNLPQIDQLIADHGNAVISLAPSKPIRAELLPLGAAGEAT